MRRRLALLAMVGASALGGSLAAQTSLLPPGFDEKPATSRPSRTAAPTTPRPVATPHATPTTAPVKPAAVASAPAHAAPPAIPVAAPAPTGPVPAASAAVVAGDSLDDIDPAVIDQLVRSVQPRSDIPPQAQRSLARVGFLDQREGGFPATSTHYLNGEFVSDLIGRIDGSLVSRWGHILLRRVLASRLDTPVGMDGADWAAVRASLLLRMGEADAARALVQEVDSGFYTRSLEDAALGSFLATADPVGICPITALTAAGHPGWDWDLARAICLAFAGNEGSSSLAQLDHAMKRGTAAKIDILLAEKFAGAANTTHRAVQIEWADADGLTPWRTGLAFATGIEPPETLRNKDWHAYAVLAGRAPMLPLASRAAAADVTAWQGILSSAAMVDLYSEIAALQEPDSTWGPLAGQLRTAYVAAGESDRLAAIKALWGDSSDPARLYSRQVLTAYAAARMEPSGSLADEAPALLASMLAAGLDRNAARWAPYVPLGSAAWGILAVAAPVKLAALSADNVASYAGNTSDGHAGLLLAGLMGLGRIDPQTAQSAAAKLKLDLAHSSRWTAAIDEAAASNNPALVALLAAYGMQGDGWSEMTALHLYHIVAALHHVGLDGEARMIAAEAVARG